MITEQQYIDAKVAKKAAEATIAEYHKQDQEAFEARWKRFTDGEQFFADDELRYSAGARCDTCAAGMAYPEECGVHHQWSCSANLKGEIREPHASYPFAFYSIKAEGQPSAQGATTRPGGVPKPI